MKKTFDKYVKAVQDQEDAYINMYHPILNIAHKIAKMEDKTIDHRTSIDINDSGRTITVNYFYDDNDGEIYFTITFPVEYLWNPEWETIEQKRIEVLRVKEAKDVLEALKEDEVRRYNMDLALKAEYEK